MSNFFKKSKFLAGAQVKLLGKPQLPVTPGIWPKPHGLAARSGLLRQPTCAVERAQSRVSDIPVWVQTPIAASSRLHEPHKVTSLSGFISPSLFFPLEQGSPPPSHGPFRNVAAHQEVSGRKAREASICVYSHSPSLALPPELLLLNKLKSVECT